jgi:hypothetical protein
MMTWLRDYGMDENYETGFQPAILNSPDEPKALPLNQTVGLQREPSIPGTVLGILSE